MANDQWEKCDYQAMAHAAWMAGISFDPKGHWIGGIALAMVKLDRLWSLVDRMEVVSYPEWKREALNLIGEIKREVGKRI